uniref:C1q domain-containing protein n=1 Tax=Amphiprion percula TaxID=161767 RepID=A0A3P8THA8_AMPPE
ARCTPRNLVLLTCSMVAPFIESCVRIFVRPSEINHRFFCFVHIDGEIVGSAPYCDEHKSIFTAPVKGLYYLRFIGCVGNSGTLNATLLQNGVYKFEIYNPLCAHSSGSNGMMLVSEKSEQVWITLWPDSVVFDQSQLTTFSDFLVFPK